MSDDLVADFCHYYFNYHHVGPRRRQETRMVLRRLEEFLGDRPITQVTAEDIEAYIIDRGINPATVVKYLSSIKPFVRWIARKGLVEADRLIPILDLRPPRGANWGKPKPYTPQEIARMWEDFDRSYHWTTETDPLDNSPRRAEYWVERWERNRTEDLYWRNVRCYARRLQAEAIIALALFGGLRRGEIFNLKLQDMHYDNEYIHVAGSRKNPAKQQVERAVPMVKPLQIVLANWIEFREQVLQPNHDRPWLQLYHLSHGTEPMRYPAFALVLPHVQGNWCMHRLRHTYATERLRAGMPVETLQKILGHANIAMTLRYAEIGTEDILRVAAQSNDQFSAGLARAA